MSGRQEGARRLDLLALAVELDAERGKQLLDFAAADLEPAQALDLAEIEFERPGGLRHFAGNGDLAWRAAAEIEHQPGGKLEPRHDEIGIDAALEPEPRVRLNAELPSGARGALGIEISRTR